MASKLLLTSALVVTLVTTGCAHQGLGGSDYSRQQARVVVSTVEGTVVSVRDVKIEGDGQNKTNNAIGAGVGAVAGSAIGKTTPLKIVGAALGGFAGYQAASMIAAATSEKKGVELVVSLKEPANGKGKRSKLVTVTQEASPNEVFNKGDKIYLTVDNKGVSRVFKGS